MKIGEKRIYNTAFIDKQDVVLWDVFHVSNGETILLSFESKKSEWSQGVWLMCDEGGEIDGSIGNSAMLWYETAPKQVRIKCHSKDGLLNVYNILDRGHGVNSQSHTSGMIIEEIAYGRRYRCNDIGLQTEFNKLVFRIEHLTKDDQ